MPSALDTTPAGADANAYISEADATAKAGADVGRYALAWLALTAPEREKAILRATRDVEAYVGYLDPPYDNTTPQALLFPRWFDQDGAGDAVIPKAVEQATYEQAVYVAKVADLIDDSASRRARGLANFSEQNVSGQLATEPYYGQYAPRMRRLLDGPGIERGGAVMGTIVRGL